MRIAISNMAHPSCSATYPYWAATQIDRLKVMLIPLIALLLPLIRIFPPTYRWRVRSRIYRWYREHQAANPSATEGLGSADLRERLVEVERIEAEAAKVPTPTSYAEEFYSLRLHIEFVRQRIEKAITMGNGSWAKRRRGDLKGASTRRAPRFRAPPKMNRHLEESCGKFLTDRVMQMNLCFCASMVLILASIGCSAPVSSTTGSRPQLQEPQATAPRVARLVKLETSISGVLLVNPNHNLGSYDQLMVDPIIVTFDSDSKKLSQSETRRLEDYLRKATARELVNVDASKIVSQPGRCVMRMQTAFLEVELPDPKPYSASTTSFVDSFGSVILIHELRDSMTGTVLLRYMGRRKARGGQVIGWVAAWSGLTRTFNGMLSDLKMELVETVPLSRAEEGPLASCGGLIHKRIDAGSESEEG